MGFLINGIHRKTFEKQTDNTFHFPANSKFQLLGTGKRWAPAYHEALFGRAAGQKSLHTPVAMVVPINRLSFGLSVFG